jgi:hypothetical protein
MASVSCMPNADCSWLPVTVARFCCGPRFFAVQLAKIVFWFATTHSLFMV